MNARVKFVLVVVIAMLVVGAFLRVPPRAMGLVGDGKADDTTALRKAITAGGSVVLPRGVYRITETITVELDRVGFTSLVGDGTARIVMAGKGPALHLIGTHGGTADPTSVKAEVFDRQRMPVVRGIEIVGDHAEADGIEASGTMQLTVAEVMVRQCRHAIHLTRRNRNLIVSNCHLYHNRGVGIYYDDVNLHQSNIVGCHVSYCAGGGVVIRGGEVRNVHIGTCDIESNMTPDGPPTANVLIDCTGGSTDEVAITGCTLQHNSKSAGSANIRVVGKGITSARNPTPTQEGHIAITGNVFSDVKVNIHLQNARGVSIVGNTFWEGFEHDLLIEDSVAVVVGANDFDRNPRYTVNGQWGKDQGGLTFKNCADCKLSGFLVKGVWVRPVAVSMAACDRCTVTDVSILDCDGIGLRLQDCTRCRVSECEIRDDREGEARKATKSIVVAGGKENRLRGNAFGNGAEIDKDAAQVEGNWTK